MIDNDFKGNLHYTTATGNGSSGLLFPRISSVCLWKEQLHFNRMLPELTHKNQSLLTGQLFLRSPGLESKLGP